MKGSEDPDQAMSMALATLVEQAEDTLFEQLDRTVAAHWPGLDQDDRDGRALCCLIDLGRPDVAQAYRRWIDAGSADGA